VEIISLSLGWAGLHDEWAEDVRAVTSAGVLVVAASGNEYVENSEMQTRSPGNYPIAGLVSVGAHDPNTHVWTKSGGGLISWPKESAFTATTPNMVPSLLAPGDQIVAAAPHGEYRMEGGSSMATPHFAGLVAAALSGYRKRGRNKSAREISEDLLRFTIDRGDPGVDVRYGRGVIDASAFMTFLRQELQ
jgi:subtilisin family serine protease